MKPGIIRGRYEALVNDRDPFLRRGRNAALLTIPTLLPEEGHTNTSDLPTPYQSLGADGVNSLASKMTLALFPPASAFFKLEIDDFLLAREMQKAGVQPDAQTLAQIRSEMDISLRLVEDAVAREVDATGIRTHIHEALRLQVASGNALVYIPDRDPMRVFRLDQFVVERDPYDNVLTIITRERVSPSALPDDVRERVNTSGGGVEKTVFLHTMATRVDEDTFEIAQEVGQVLLEEDIYEVKERDLPFIHLRHHKVTGESYGRGMVEEYFGDLKAHEVLSRALLEGAAAAARILFLVKPQSTLSPRQLQKTPNGGYVQGQEGDVFPLQLNKYADFQFVSGYLQTLSERLSAAFLLNTSVTRDAERVTAREIAFLAQELEDKLGGVYSVTGQDFQLPLVHRLMRRMRIAGKLPELSIKEGSIIQPKVITGVDALGRGHDLQKLNQFVLGIVQGMPPEVAARIINWDEFARRGAVGLGIKPGLVKSEEQLAIEAQQAQQQALIQQTAAPVSQQLARGAVEQSQAQAQQEPQE